MPEIDYYKARFEEQDEVPADSPEAIEWLREHPEQEGGEQNGD